MECPNCNSQKFHKNGKDPKTGKQKYKCTQCGKEFNEDTATKNPKLGMTLDQFKSKHDVDFIIEQTLKKLDANIIYEKADIYKLSGLNASHPGLTAAIEARPEYYGKISGRLYFSHPDTIAELKRNAKIN